MTQNPKNLTLECKTCGKETTHIYAGKGSLEKTLSEYGKKPVMIKKPLLGYCCSVCNTHHDMIERRTHYGERRKMSYGH